MKASQEEADYVVIGAGSSGCVAANMLAEGNNVIVLEYGGSDAGPFINMPAALSYPMNMKLYDWGFMTQPEPHLNGRQLACPRGKVIGGSSSINGMVYVRGHARDFDYWDEQGAKGWAYKNVQPYFEKIENAHGGADGEGRGKNGPLHVARGEMNNPLFQAFVQAGQQAGFEVTNDYNGLKQEGFGAMEQTIYEGQRWSAAKAFLKPALKKYPSLRMVRCFVQRILFDGKKAVGVEIKKNGQVSQVKANKEVILAASTINTPKLLMLSGIGPAKHLNEHGIDLVADRQGVGQNLQDHPELYIQQKCTKNITLNSKVGLMAKGIIGLQWLLFKKGIGASNHFESVGFVRSKKGVEYPDIQFHFLPVAIRYDGKAPAKGHGFQVHVGPMRAKSKGFVRLADSDPMTPPKIQFNYLEHPDDLKDFRYCIRLAREIFAQHAFDSFRGDEIAPGEDVQSDDELDEYTRQNIESAYHPCGTAKMGDVNDPTAVVDPECRVIGVDRLRVIDTSIFPRIPNGNLNSPALMTATKACDHILGNKMLPESNLQPWINPRWQESDR